MFKLAMIQMRVQGGAGEENLARATKLLDQAAANGARAAVLPEALDLGWTDPSALTNAQAIPNGPACECLRARAARHGMYVCAGLTERSARHVFNAAVLFDAEGRLILRHRKINELEIGRAYYALGDGLGVVDTPLGRLGVMICADAFAEGQVVSRTLGLMGAEVILSPCAWAVEKDHDNARGPYGKLWRDSYGPVAKDFGLWIAGVSNVGWLTAGPWQGRKCIGCSLLVGPSGEPVMAGPYGAEAETILYAEIGA